MWLLILEAAAAFFLLAFIVWWTMFSGRIEDTGVEAEPEPMPTAGAATGMESPPVMPAAPVTPSAPDTPAVATASTVSPPQP